MTNRVCAIGLLVLVAISSCQALLPWAYMAGMGGGQGGGGGANFGNPTLLGAMTVPCNPMARHNGMGAGRRGMGPVGRSPGTARGAPGVAPRGQANSMQGQTGQSYAFNPLIGAMIDVPDAPDFPMIGAGFTGCYCQNFESSCVGFGDPVCGQFGLCCSCELFFKR